MHFISDTPTDGADPCNFDHIIIYDNALIKTLMMLGGVYNIQLPSTHPIPVSVFEGSLPSVAQNHIHLGKIPFGP